jgi:hypothetical protein
MSLKDDFMYPFGNPVRERLQQNETRTALRNVLKLAQDKVRSSNGDLEEILITADDGTAKQSIEIVDQLLKFLDGKEKTNTTNS